MGGKAIALQADITLVRKTIQAYPMVPALKRIVARHVYKWDIDPTAYIGPSVLTIERLSMGPGTAIGAEVDEGDHRLADARDVRFGI